MIEQFEPAFKTLGDVACLDRLRRVVAYSSRSSQKDHCHGNFLGQDHGVVAGAADHAVRLASSLSHGFFDLVDKKRVHIYRRLAEEFTPPQS